MKLKLSRFGEIILRFTDTGKSCPCRIFLTSPICLNAIRENKILAKITEFTVHVLTLTFLTNQLEASIFQF